MQLIPVILCGGVGSRLWPVSRDLHPKPFIRLADGQSLLQKAFLRGAALPGVKELLTVTNREFFFKAEEEYRSVNKTGLTISFILEPFGRNTAAAVATAALQLTKMHGEDAVMLVLAADHLIADQDAFAMAVAEAAAIAERGSLVTFGILPDIPETGYGYIEAEGNTVLRFVEKPSFDEAQAFLESGRFLWNSGMFCFKAGTILQAMERHCPDILSAAKACIGRSKPAENGGSTQIDLDPESFAQVPENSIDYAIMEKAAQAIPSPNGVAFTEEAPGRIGAGSGGGVAVVPCNIGWSDIGSWNAMGELTEPDAQGNRVEGEVLLHEVANSYIRSNGRMVCASGVENLIVIDTPDALLVTDKSRAQDVKHIYAVLKSQGHETHKLHRTVHRPWGTYTVLGEGNRFKIKSIKVKPGASLSLQMHHHRCEHWIVVNGMAKVVNGKKEILVNTNESTFIPAGHHHRLENPGMLDLVMIEVQSGDYLGEDDIVRFQDIYGRC
ncbi:MAG: sugar phosphate nucleotidyltransferase [Hyphomicrobiales bacterium]